MKIGKTLYKKNLGTLLAISPHRRILQDRQYVEMTPEMCALMNKDLTFNPQIKFTAGALLAGSILLNTKNGQSIMINKVEVYGRTKNVDLHRESFGKLKNGTQTTSLPPPITTPYPDVWPVIIQRNEGQKLVIGTQVLNVLVTSNMRLDQSQPPSIGPLTTNFMLTNVTDSLGCRIFVDGTSLKQLWN